MDPSSELVEIEEKGEMPHDDISEDVLSLSKETCEDDDPYDVTWTIHMALAVPPEEGEVCTEHKRGQKKAHPDRGCYHIEYKLLPGDTETVKLDLLLFGPVAKLYKEEGSKILPTWTEGGQTWVGWSQDFTVKVDRSLITQLLHHKVTVHMWNHRDKLLSPARSERHRALRLTQDLTDDPQTSDDVKSIVTKVRSLCPKTVSKEQLFRSVSKLEIKDKSLTLVQTATDGVCDPGVEVDLASVQFSPVPFLAGEESLTEWALVGSCCVNECMIHISLHKPLLSDHLKAELNPLAITIVSASSMPSSPVPFHVLEEKCIPVYCQYQFHNLKKHRTSYEKHGDKIYFRDVNVIFTGLLNPRDLHEFLSGPPMKIEIHDRDRRRDDKTPVGLSCGFNGISTGATSKRKNDFNYHGVANLNLSPLLLGTTNFKVCLPIKSCTLPPDLDKTRDLSVLPGHYIDANSVLKARIKLACPLNFSKNNNGSTSEALFGRVIYIFHRNNFAVMDKLRLEILKTNADAFQLDSYALENTENALSNYTTSFKRSPDLDFVTGFHLVDKKTQIVAVEGLRRKAVKRLRESVAMKLSGSKEEQVIALYTSSLAFFKRIYDSLDLSLTPIVLPESLETILMEPLVYVKGTIPPLCLQGLLRLQQLRQARSLTEAAQNDLFPSADMIQSLSRQYKTPTQQWKRDLGVIKPRSEQVPVLIKSQSTSQTTDAEEDFHCYVNKRHGTFRKLRDFIQENKRKVHEDSARLQRSVSTLRLKTDDDGPAHNYSIQTFNTNVLNKEWLQQQMAKLPGRRFTYSQEYYSATVEPAEYTVSTPSTPTADRPPDRCEVPILKAKVPSAKGVHRFVACYKTWDSGLSRSEMHPQTPDQARVEELRKPWRENILHGNILKPPLSRGPWSWTRRSQDFQLYRKAAPFFNTWPLSVQVDGESGLEEQTLAAKAQHRQSESSTGPLPEFKCHMAETDKFHNLLKDEPQKYSLRKPGMILKPVPHLSVISRSGDVTDAQRSAALAPGPRMDWSLSSRNNAIPRHSTEFYKYHYMQV
ncbi:uncharacterized protein cfap92 [Periophthalmus magnuspinnatus]|uniref:uncharacterized protein cfap92 n=1 Tax=Periophthalmus magnuspinnatus TaxID=409849 RepID=UPI002436396D|nr:uncharacterized protein cfap92 [Periophthalmus magnuspinnatus]